MLLLRDTLLMYHKLRGTQELTNHLDERYLPKFAEACICLAIVVVQPLIPAVAHQGPPAAYQTICGLHKMLMDLGQLRTWEDYDLSPHYHLFLKPWHEFAANFIDPLFHLDDPVFRSVIWQSVYHVAFEPLKSDLQK